MGTIVYGPVVEPGGMELDDYNFVGKCQLCGGSNCHHRHWETADGGCINQHWQSHCPYCGFTDSDPYPDDEEP